MMRQFIDSRPEGTEKEMIAHVPRATYQDSPGKEADPASSQAQNDFKQSREILSLILSLHLGTAHGTQYLFRTRDTISLRY